MQTFELSSIQQRRQASGGPWLEFLRAPSLSMGLYELAVGSADRQQPHSEDEVYYVVSGRGYIQVDGVDRAVQAGSIVFVAARVPHRFYRIVEDLSVLVFFAPPEGSQGAQMDG